MAINGVDYSWARPDPACMFKAGKRFAVRYVSYSTTGKNMTAAEVKKLTAAGIAMVTVWQGGKSDGLGGRSAGVKHATDADKMHRSLGGGSRPIYFAIDHDANSSELATWYQYLSGAASVIGWSRVGVYGGIKQIRYMTGKGVKWLWQTYAWSGGQWDSRAQLQQYRNGVTLCGGTVDLCRATTDDYGQWGLSGGGGSSPGGGNTMSWQEHLKPSKLAASRFPDGYSTRADKAVMHILGLAWEGNHGKIRPSKSDLARWPKLNPKGYSPRALQRYTYAWSRRGAEQAARNSDKLDALMDHLAGMDTSAILQRIDERHAERSAEIEALGNQLDGLQELVEQHADGTLDADAVVQKIGELLLGGSADPGDEPDGEEEN